MKYLFAIMLSLISFGTQSYAQSRGGSLPPGFRYVNENTIEKTDPNAVIVDDGVHGRTMIGSDGSTARMLVCSSGGGGCIIGPDLAGAMPCATWTSGPYTICGCTVGEVLGCKFVGSPAQN